MPLPDPQVIKKLTKNPLFRETLIYGLTNALYTGLPLLLMPFLVATLSPEDYGIIELFRNLTMVIVPILGLSTVQSISRYYYDLDSGKFNRFSSTIILFQMIMAVLGCILVTVLSNWISKESSIIAYLTILFFVFQQITEILLTRFRVLKQAQKFMFFRIATVVLDVGLLAGFYFMLDSYDWTYRVFPQVLAVVVIGFFSFFWFYFKEDNKFQFDLDLLKTAILFSAPLIIHMLSGYMLNIGDRFFILSFLDEKALGSYSLAYQISLVVSFIYTSFNLAWTPTFFEWMKEKKYRSIKKVQKIIFSAVMLLAIISYILFFIFQEYIPNIKSYNISNELILILISANVFMCFYKFYANYLIFEKKTKLLSLISLSMAGLTILLNVILIPKIGILGAAITTLVTFLLMFSILKTYHAKNY